ncbi:MAG: membrane dipeptidase, partial [Terriglobus roseus]|nr:membrane dipeptidase [Terriglobus roseus]
MAFLSRRSFLRNTSALAAAPAVLRHNYRVFAQSAQRYPERVVRLMRESIVIDMLNQFVSRVDRFDQLEGWLNQPNTFTEADFKKFQASGLTALAFGRGADTFAEAQSLFGQWNTFILTHPQWFLRINHVEDFADAKRTNRIGILYSLQTSDQFEDLKDVDGCYGLGLRSSQLSYNWRARVADGPFETHDGGVSEYGARVIGRMNTVGMVVDLGHASDLTKADALRISKVTPIISHSNCRALIPNGIRSTSDDTLRQLAARGGVIGITDIAWMVKATEPVTIEDVVNHYDHVRDLVGIEHVGMGSDSGIESNDYLTPKERDAFFDKLDNRYNKHGVAEVVV